MPTGQRISEDTKKEAVRRVERGEDLGDVARELGFAESSYDKMRQKYGKGSRAKRKIMTKKSPPRRNVFQEKVKGLEKEVDFWKNKYTELLYERNE